MRTFDVWLDSGVSVELPDETDPDADEGIEAIKAAAAEKFRMMLESDAINFDVTIEDGDL
jgi:hypothetical protein